MAVEYGEIDKLVNNQNQMLDQALQQQQDITNQQTQMQIDELNRNKEQIDKDTNKTTAGLYTEYQKQVNPYGANAEAMARNGLANSGYAETSKVNLYNQYQKNVTDTLSNAQQLKSDFDFKINQARQTGNITLAQNALEIYNQRMKLLSEEYELRNNREQFLYQKERDMVADNKWQKEYEQSQNQWQQTFDYNKNRDQISDNQWQQSFDYQRQRDDRSDSQWQQTFDYQKQRDHVSDSQWQKQYELSKKASSRSSSSSRSTGSKKKSGEGGLKVNEGNENNNTNANAVNGSNEGKVSLSGTGQALLVMGQKSVSMGNKTSASGAIANAYARGQISDEEAAYICNKLGI